MDDSVRTALQEELVRQTQAGLHPQDSVVVNQGGAAVAPGLPADYLLAPQGDGMRGSVCDLNGTPSRITTASDLSKLTVNYNGISMRCSDAVAHGLAVVRNGAITFADELAKVEQAQRQPSEQPSGQQETPKGEPEGQSEADATHAEIGTEVATVDALLIQHTGSNAAGLALKYFRGEDVSHELDVLVRAGAAEDGMAAVQWLEQTAGYVQDQLSGVLDKAGLDGAAVLAYIAEDRNVSPMVERALAQWVATGSAEVWRPVLQHMHDAGKLAQFMKKVAAA
jgi:hypothetical protein